MKRIIIIFIIVLCLLSFIEISFLTEELFNYGEFWNSFSNGEKMVYLSGMHVGMSKCISDFLELVLPEKEEEKKFADFFVEYYRFLSPSNFEVRARGISDLYKDPANTYIPIAEINFLAYRKLRGESIELPLRELRKKALP